MTDSTVAFIVRTVVDTGCCSSYSSSVDTLLIVAIAMLSVSASSTGTALEEEEEASSSISGY